MTYAVKVAGVAVKAVTVCVALVVVVFGTFVLAFAGWWLGWHLAQVIFGPIGEP